LLARTDTQDLFRAERQQAEASLESSSSGAAGGAAIAMGEHSSTAASRGERKRNYARAALAEHRHKAREERGDEGILAGHPARRGVIAALVLSIATSGMATMSGAFAKAVETLTARNVSLHQYEFSLGLILIPMLAGVVELYGSVEAARVNRMEITMAVTAGAIIQMILLIVPILVLVGLTTGHPLALVFTPIEILIVGVATVIFIQLSRDGELTWLKGIQLCGLWALVACASLFLPPHLTLTP
jgi:calcium/proton exchanger cax